MPARISVSRESVEKDEDTLLLLDVILEILTRLLEMESFTCKGAALHGLGHLDHPGKVPVLERFIENPPETDANWREYAEACITGDIM
jgi:hypothetical protein